MAPSLQEHNVSPEVQVVVIAQLLQGNPSEAEHLGLPARPPKIVALLPEIDTLDTPVTEETTGASAKAENPAPARAKVKQIMSDLAVMRS